MRKCLESSHTQAEHETPADGVIFGHTFLRGASVIDWRRCIGALAAGAFAALPIIAKAQSSTCLRQVGRKRRREARPSRYELVIHHRVAKARRLTIPQS